MDTTGHRLILGGAMLLRAGLAAELSDASVPPERRPELSRAALEEIVVTARRREERLLDVPISVSVLPGIVLERRQIDNIDALEHAVPNLSVTPWPGNSLRATISMRGQVEPDRFPTVDPAVGVYLDGVYISRIAGANLDLVDIERVEVMRGPQGTLFGRNTTGGAINLVPRRPDAALAAELTVGFGNYDRRELEAIVNAPFREGRHALRVVASHVEHDGYGRNTLLGRDLNANDTTFLRAQFHSNPADRWDLNVSFDYTQSAADIGLVTLMDVTPPLTFYPAASGHPDDRLENYVDPTARSVQANRVGTAKADVWGASGVLTFDVRPAALKLLLASRGLDAGHDGQDVDGTPYDLFAVLAREESQDQWSLELQAYGDALGKRLSWIGGLHYFDERAEYFEDFLGTQSTTLVASQTRPAGTARNDSAAAYAQFVYALLPSLRVTAGARYNTDRRQLTSRNSLSLDGAEACTLAPGLRDQPGLCRATMPEQSFSYVPWTVGIDYEPAPDALVYAKLSRGHRAGGYNFRALTGTAADTFEPESVTTWEVGVRAELLQRRLRVALSLYRSQFNDMQVRTVVPLPPANLSVPLTQNAGEARIHGGELEIEAMLGELRLSGAVGIARGEYTEIEPTALDVSLDSQFLQTPDTTVTVAADMPLSTALGGIDLHVDCAWRDEESFAYASDSLARQEAFGLLNAMIVARFDATNLELQLWGRNLSDERYIERAVELGPSLVNAVPGDPRTYGASLRYWFGQRSVAR